MSSSSSDKIAAWEQQINEITQRFVQTFGKLNATQLNHKPNANTWSIAQNIEHLIVINNSYQPIIEQIRQGKYRIPLLGRMGFLQRFFGNFILKSVLPSNRKKIKTFPIWQPTASNISADIVQRFATHQKQLIALIKSCQDLLDKGQAICSPASRTIVYPLATAFEIIVQHELRHFEQAQSLLP